MTAQSSPKLTAAQIAHDTQNLPDMRGDCVVLPFVRDHDGVYHLSSIFQCDWQELLTMYMPERRRNAPPT